MGSSCEDDRRAQGGAEWGVWVGYMRHCSWRSWRCARRWAPGVRRLGPPARPPLLRPASRGLRRLSRRWSGPWRAWSTGLSRQEASGSCGATAHQVVCATRSGGLVGRSRANGKITWQVLAAGSGKSAGLVVDSAHERAVSGVGGVLQAANLRTGRAAWTKRLAVGRVYVGIGAADGTVYAFDAPLHTAGNVALTALRASDGTPLWRRDVAADPVEGIAAFGGRVYTTDGRRVTARTARTGDTVATSPPGTACPHLASGGHYLVCTGSPLSAEDVFPPMRRLDPTTLEPLPTPKDTGQKPVRALISPDGVLMLFEASAEDSSAGDWNAYDLKSRRRLWSYYDTTPEGAFTDGRFVTFTPGNDRVTRGRVITIDLHTGPQATGAAAPAMSASYPQTRDGEGPLLIVPGDTARHVVVMARTHGSLRSMPLP
ncbi:PQQ-binding-like beta-propeller repeat protein [Streptomyces sp. NPDC085900]|uniref:outer membrane protein assembly factor BamB family protein n=1 Tax=Streptomyces sp. NPDC085900 TaxID=3365737 RepID=UPI0037D53612